MSRCVNPESGFSLAALIFFLTAASIAIVATLPSYQMQAKRAQEEELIFRGEEYIRAIQKFQRKTGTYPPTIDALVQTNGIRFLRRQYTDPITGKPFRLIYVNADGTLSGSVLVKTLAQAASNTNNNGPGTANGTGGTNNPGANATGTNNGISRGNNNNLSTGIGGQGIGQGIGGQPIGQGIGGTGIGQGIGGQPIGQGIGGTGIGQGIGGQPIGQGIGGTGFASGSGGTAGGLFRTGGGTSPGTGTGNSPNPIAAGIVGVASDSELASLKVYNTRQKYNEWEFIAILMPNLPNLNSNPQNNPLNPPNNQNRNNTNTQPPGFGPGMNQPGTGVPSVPGPGFQPTSPTSPFGFGPPTQRRP